jgi:hypothetical protein
MSFFAMVPPHNSMRALWAAVGVSRRKSGPASATSPPMLWPTITKRRQDATVFEFELKLRGIRFTLMVPIVGEAKYGALKY